MMRIQEAADTFRPDSGSRVLVVEDDLPLAQLIRQQLETQSYAVSTVHDGESGHQAILNGRFDLVILDLNLPKLDGVSLLRKIRPSLPRLPVLVLTARNRVEDRALSLDTGADDCVVKPFSFIELHARVRALLRRSSGPLSKVSQVADLILNREQRRVERNGRRIELTAREFDLLDYLMRNAGRPVSRNILMEEVWNLPFDPSSNVVDVYVKFLQNESLNLKSEETSLAGVDTATALTNLSQAQTAAQATLAAVAKVMPETLLDYLK